MKTTEILKDIYKKNLKYQTVEKTRKNIKKNESVKCVF